MGITWGQLKGEMNLMLGLAPKTLHAASITKNRHLAEKPGPLKMASVQLPKTAGM